MNHNKNININGSISGIVNFGSNSININEKNNIIQQDDNTIERSKINSHTNFTELKKDTSSNNIIKRITEIIIGVIISVIAGYILYKLNMN